MALPNAPASISMAQINTELGRGSTATLCLNDASARSLAQVPSGQISMSNFYGKSSGPPPPTPPGALGTPYCGGYYIGTFGSFYVIAAPNSSGAVGTNPWRRPQGSPISIGGAASPAACQYNPESGNTGLGNDGYNNTRNTGNGLAPCNFCFYGFTWARSLNINGFADWYIGSYSQVNTARNNRASPPQDGCPATNLWSSSNCTWSSAAGVSMQSTSNVHSTKASSLSYRAYRRSPQSDIRLKKNITKIKNAGAIVKQLNGYKFDWNDLYEKHYGKRDITNKKEIGVMAQEVNQVLPELIEIDNHGHLTVQYEKLTPVLIEAIKELQIKLENCENKIQLIENKFYEYA